MALRRSAAGHGGRGAGRRGDGRWCRSALPRPHELPHRHTDAVHTRYARAIHPGAEQSRTADRRAGPDHPIDHGAYRPGSTHRRFRPRSRQHSRSNRPADEEVRGRAGGLRHGLRQRRRLAGGAVDTRTSTAYAEAVAKQLPSAAPQFFPPYNKEIIRGYHNTDPRIPSGTAEIELFFLLH